MIRPTRFAFAFVVLLAAPGLAPVSAQDAPSRVDRAKVAYDAGDYAASGTLYAEGIAAGEAAND